MAGHPEPLSESDEEVRLECIRLAMAFGTGDPIETAEKLFQYIKSGQGQ
jgi:hypothetical protein